ncbi:NUDIX domain-containing protein [Microbacterium dextranolyticum]|uniref:NUDIX hydrolase n=1 Tax=Microbacterium dextranolyticum TaxID=36806 RepID=A0A9W6HPQ4_9MICO|nr:NUDIX hydrolase [Microbacterium dextranolyticum]MBM7462481.1 ADP-ribose pyrophosphatase [Microbacterium dextranolyticum]GLJ96339.1 NUDIX hydrolase [Microbacterium dextranolyticum]
MTESEALRDDPTPVDLLDTQRAFQGRVWDIRRDEFAYNGASIVREYMDHTGAVAVLALDDDGRVLLIKQYRHPIRTRDWEIPAGLLDIDGEDPLVAAQRELAEEADLTATQWDLLGEFFTSPGGSDESIRIYLARGLAPTAEAFARDDEEADIEVRWVSLDEVVDAVLARRVQNAALIVAALSAHASRARGWSTLAPADEPWARRGRGQSESELPGAPTA